MAGTQEWEDFLNDPLDKPVTDIPSVDSALGKMMKQKGFDTTNKLLEKFVELDEDEGEFFSWLEEEFGATSDQASTCAKVLAVCKEEEEQDWDTFTGDEEDKPVTAIPGIGRALGRRLRKIYSNASTLLTIYQEMTYGHDEFLAFLMTNFDATEEQAAACANALIGWYSGFREFDDHYIKYGSL